MWIEPYEYTSMKFKAIYNIAPLGKGVNAGLNYVFLLIPRRTDMSQAAGIFIG